MRATLKNILIALAIGTLPYVATIFKKPINKVSSLHSEVFAVDNGYGYRILNGHRVLIQQKFIPAINGKHTFYSEKDAQLVGNLVAYKLINGHSPLVTIEELKKLNVAPLK